MNEATSMSSATLSCMLAVSFEKWFGNLWSHDKEKDVYKNGWRSSSRAPVQVCEWMTVQPVTFKPQGFFNPMLKSTSG